MKRALFIALLSLWPSWVFAAAPAYDQSNTNFNNSSTLTVTLGHTNGSKECDVIFAGGFSGTSITSVTDNGATLTPIITGIKHNGTTYNAYEVAASAGTVNIVANGSPAGGLVLAQASYTNCGGVNVSSSNQNTGGTAVTDTFSTTVANTTVVSYEGNYQAGTDNWGGANRLNEPNINNSKLDDKTIAAAGSVTTDWSQAGSGGNIGVMDIALCPVGGCTAPSTSVIQGIINAFARWW